VQEVRSDEYRVSSNDERYSNRPQNWRNGPPRPPQQAVLVGVPGLWRKWGHTSLSSLHGDLPHTVDSASSGPIFTHNAVRPISQ
jgi:hypothetical protein